MIHGDGIPVTGQQCEAIAKTTGQRCRQSAFAKVRPRHSQEDGVWLCRAHQGHLRNKIGLLELVEKWKANGHGG